MRGLRVFKEPCWGLGALGTRMERERSGEDRFVWVGDVMPFVGVRKWGHPGEGAKIDRLRKAAGARQGRKQVGYAGWGRGPGTEESGRWSHAALRLLLSCEAQ